MSAAGEKRQYGLWLALALTVAATLWTATNEDDTAADAPMAARAYARPRAAIPCSVRPSVPPATLDLTVLHQPRLGAAPGELFDSEPPPDKQAELVAAAPPPPAVPPLPYIYAGKLIDGDSYIVFLSEGDKNYSVRVGDALGDWRVKAIRPPQMILSYVPMQAEVPLMIGEAN